jgi:hypothetical protein
MHKAVQTTPANTIGYICEEIAQLETDCLHSKSNEMILTAVTLFLPLSSICVLEWLTPVRSVQ